MPSASSATAVVIGVSKSVDLKDLGGWSVKRGEVVWVYSGEALWSSESVLSFEGV